jgi:hypothetical protein
LVRDAPVSPTVGAVFGASPPSQIIQSVVGPNIVAVERFHAFGTWAGKGNQQQGVNKTVKGCTVAR